MIERIKNIKNIGAYENSGNGQIKLDRFSYIYAANTYGKTTFCDIIRSLKTRDCFYILNRRRIGIKPSEKCEVDLTINGCNVRFSDGAWHIPTDADIGRDLEVFDINFVDENVFTNGNIEHKNKENLTAFILGERSVELVKKLGDLESCLSQKKEEFSRRKESLESNLESIGFDTIRKISFVEDFKDKESLMMSIKEARSVAIKQRDNISAIKGTSAISLLNCDYFTIKDIVRQVKAICGFSIDIDLTKLIEDVNRIKTQIPDISDAWIKEGVKLKTNLCPFCGEDITQNERIKVFSEYFSQSIVNLLDNVENAQSNVMRNYRSVGLASLINKIRQQVSDIKKYAMSDKCEIIERNLDEINELDLKLIATIDRSRKELDSALTLKLQSFTRCDYEFNDTNEVLGIIAEMETKITAFNNLINEVNADFDEFKNGLTHESLDLKIKTLTSEYYEANLILIRGMNDSAINTLNQLDDHINELKKKIKDTRTEIDNKETEFLDTYFAEIQEIYKKLGSENYRLERETTPRGKKKVYGIKIYFKDNLVDQNRFCLSESDKRALALSIFLAKIKVDRNSNAILVLDDPITSFDKDRMRLFALLLQDLSKSCFTQVILLMHYENFFRSINNFTTENKVVLKIQRDRNNHVFVPLSPDDGIFKDDYEALLDKVIKFINAEINDIAENEVRILFENYLHRYYAYETSKTSELKGKGLHEFIIILAKHGYLANECKDELLDRLRFLNDSSHSFNGYSEEEKRSFIKDAYECLHNLHK